VRKFFFLVSILSLAAVCQAQTITDAFFGMHKQCSAVLNGATNYNPDCGNKTVPWLNLSTAPVPSHPVGSLRFWDNKTKFGQIANVSTSTPQTSWNWVAFDHWIGVIRAQGVEGYFSAGGNTPSWACSGPCASPVATSVPTDAAWTQWITALLQRKLDTVTGAYCTSGATCRPVACQLTGTWAGIKVGCLDSLEIWNEPNGYYAGTMGQMVHLAALAKAARNGQAGVNVEIVSPAYTYASSIAGTGVCAHFGTNGSPELFTCMFLQATSSVSAEGKGKDQIDAIAFHPYPSTNNLKSTSSTTGIAEATVNNRSNGIKTAMTDNGLTPCTPAVTSNCKQWLASEFSWGYTGGSGSSTTNELHSGTCPYSGGCPRIGPLNDYTATPPESTCDEDTLVAYQGYGCAYSDQSATLIKLYVMGRGHGWRQAFWYWWGSATSDNVWGILECPQVSANNIGCPTGGNHQNPAAYAFGTMRSWLLGATVTAACSLSGSVWSCPLTFNDGSTGLVVWDSTRGPGQSGTYSYASAWNQQTDMYGNVSVASSPVTVGYAPILLSSVPVYPPPAGRGTSGTAGVKGISAIN
jgi:hypothetical protein